MAVEGRAFVLLHEDMGMGGRFLPDDVLEVVGVVTFMGVFTFTGVADFVVLGVAGVPVWEGVAGVCVWEAA